MWLIVGLGNPGPRYERTRHNVGFRVVDELARRHIDGGFRAKFGGEVASGVLSVVSGGPGGRGAVTRHKALLLKPMEFMNLSGFAVQRAAHFHDVEPGSIVVVHDEIDIDMGRIKLKRGGGHGGHNGLRSIIQELGSNAFSRVRVGVGKPGPRPQGDGPGHVATTTAAAAAAGPDAARAAARDRRIAGYLLSDFPQAQAAEVDDMVSRAADATEAIVADGITAAMNRFHKQEVGAAPG